MSKGGYNEYGYRVTRRGKIVLVICWIACAVTINALFPFFWWK